MNIEFYEIVPEFNHEGRLCNYHTKAEPVEYIRVVEGELKREVMESDEETVRVPTDEWKRFNKLAGRQHEIIDGIVVYNEDLELCIPDNPLSLQVTLEELAEIVDMLLIDSLGGAR